MSVSRSQQEAGANHSASLWPLLGDFQQDTSLLSRIHD